MSVSKCCRKLSRTRILLALVGLNRLAHAQTPTQVELTALLDSGNLLHGPAPAAPPWEELASLRRADGNRFRLALGRSDAGFLPGLTSTALVRLELDPGLGAGERRAPALRDASSFIGVAQRVSGTVELSLRAYPFDTDYVRVGYLHALDWGGSDVGRRESVFLSQSGGVPGVRLELATSRFRLFSALKWASTTDAPGGARKLWGVLSGGHFELTRVLSADAGFGYFERPAQGIGTTRGFVEGGSLRVVWHDGVSEPELAPEPFRPPSLRDDPTRLSAEAAPGFALALEAVSLVMRERRFEAPSTETLTAAPAAALYGSVRGSRLAAHVALTWRSLAFVLRNDPSAAPGETLPLRSAALAELGAWLGGSVTLLPAHVVPSLEVGVRLPAALQTPSALPGYAQTLVPLAAGGFSALPIGAGRLPIIAARAGVRFDASTTVTLALFGEYQRNPNQTLFAASPVGVTRVFTSPDSLSLFTAAQARF